ncbi:hypothetical protein DLR11_15030 [Salmonella enterica subsp. salamae]|uniref:Uncharacterized protein n=1 Tax=Salmonella enterica subsp. salamae TaxID=59202 RepID=A0A5Y3UZZ2_SALER|nr:hypothetical protein [Salmonella enterica subsp. salamae]EDK4684458.1 hypothetical protein [Salmonella enterica]EDS1445419.1 hypothetical protein [Salmonella enterica subsp. enterica serovar Enteritidis]ECI3453115.1 hypothetical protein [Salmonella enterica subsp. salamae]ECJ2327080.1 hypothetical protein [Salmonella enterica subsp. salamae]
MIVSKKKYDFLLDRYEQAASRADLLERQLAELNGAMEKHGTPYKSILECREAAMAVSTPGSEQVWLTLERLAFIDRWASAMLPSLTRRMPDRERLMWEDMLKTRFADHAYGMVRGKSQGEKQ